MKPHAQKTKLATLVLVLAVSAPSYAESSPASATPFDKEPSTSTKKLDIKSYVEEVNNAKWSTDMKVNTAMTVKIQTLLDWNDVSVGSIDGGWGLNSKQALLNFQRMKDLETTGTMNEQTWQALTSNVDISEPIITTYTVTKADANIQTAPLAKTFETQAKQKSLPYQSVAEMLAERFHMDIAYIKKLNPNKKFEAGDVIYVVNQPHHLVASVDKVIASQKYKTLFAYQGKQLVATYPATIGNSEKPAPTGRFSLDSKIDNPWYKASITTNGKKVEYTLPPGANNAIGLVWLGLSKPSCGISGMELPEIVGRVDSTGCIKLTNWDAKELAKSITDKAVVEIQ